MASSYNTWREPIGYTSSFRPVRTPLRLNYGRDDVRIKETRGQRFEQQSKGRESTLRTFPMELRPRELFSPQPGSSRNSKYTRGRSTPRENFRRPFTPQIRSSKNSNYARGQSTPREAFRGANTSQAGSSKNSKYTRGRSTPREVFRGANAPQDGSSKNSKYTRGRSTPREVFRGANTPQDGSSKNSKYTRGRSTPREVFRGANTPQVGSSKNSKYTRGRSTPREVFRGANASQVGSSKNSKYARGRSTPREVLRGANTSQVVPHSTPREGFRDANASQVGLSKHSNYSQGHSSQREEKNTPKMSVSRLSTAKRVPDGNTHASSAPSNRAQFDHTYSSSRHRQETPQRTSRAKSTPREIPLKKAVKTSDEDTSRKFLRCQSEPPRRSARIANLLKKSDKHQGVKKDEGNLAKSRAGSRAVCRPRDSSQRDSHSGSKYKTPRTDYRSASAAPSRYSSGSKSRELQTKAEKKEMQHSYISSISIQQLSRVSPNERINEQSETDRSTNQSLSAMADIRIGSPSASAGISLRDANDLIEDRALSNQEGVEDVAIANREEGDPDDSSNQRDIEYAVDDIVNGIDDVSNSSMQLDEHQEEINEYSNNEYISRFEPQRHYFASRDNLIRQGYVSPYEPPRQYFVSNDNSRQVLDSSTPFHRRQMNVPQSYNNRADFLSQAGPSYYGATPWQGSSYNYQLSPMEYSFYQFVSWQNPYNVRAQQNVWNRHSSAQIHSQDGTYDIDEELYCVNRRVPVDNENET